MLLPDRVCTGLGKTLRSWLDQGCPHCPIFLTAAEYSSGDPYFSATVVGRSLKPTKHHRLGGPLPPPTIYYIIGSSAGGKLPFLLNYGHLTLPEGRFLFGTHPVAMKGNSPERERSLPQPSLWQPPKVLREAILPKGGFFGGIWQKTPPSYLHMTNMCNPLDSVLLSHV